MIWLLLLLFLLLPIRQGVATSSRVRLFAVAAR